MIQLREIESEEKYIRRLATGLYTVWNNNPAAFKVLKLVGLVSRAVFAENGGGFSIGMI